MKRATSSLQTKNAFAASLKKFMSIKPLTKITVNDIVRDCGANRNSFYYHFENIYDLLKWMFEQEAIEVVKNFTMIADYQEAFLFVVNYVEQNKYIISCAYDSIGRDELKRFFYSDFEGIIRSIIEAEEKKLKVPVNREFKEFLCEFFTEALAGILINRIKDPKTYSWQVVLDYMESIIQTMIPSVLKSPAARQDDRPIPDFSNKKGDR